MVGKTTGRSNKTMVSSYLCHCVDAARQEPSTIHHSPFPALWTYIDLGTPYIYSPSPKICVGSMCTLFLKLSSVGWNGLRPRSTGRREPCRHHLNPDPPGTRRPCTVYAYVSAGWTGEWVTHHQLRLRQETTPILCSLLIMSLHARRTLSRGGFTCTWT